MNSLGSSPRNQWRVNKTQANLVRAEVTPLPICFPASPQSVTLDLRHAAILVIDMQNDFCNDDGWLASIGVDVEIARSPVGPLSRLLPTLRAHEVPVVWVNWGNRPDRLNLSPSALHVYNPFGDGCGLGDPLPATGARVLELGSWSAEVISALSIAPDDVQIDKYRMSGFPDTALDSILRNLGVKHLFFAGVNLDQCVICTLQDANFHGYDCILLDDCCATTSPAFCTEATLYNVKQCFGFVSQSDALIAALGAQG